MKKNCRISGQSMVEFALIFPLFFFLVTGLFDLGRAVFAYTTLNTAVREGTRFAIVQPAGTANSVIEAKVRSYFYNIKDYNDNSTVTITKTGTTDDPRIQIHITYTFKPITPGLALIIGNGNSLQINTQSEMLLAPIAK